MIEIRAFDERDTEAVVALWHDCGLVTAANDPREDIARKLTVQRELFLVAAPGKESDGNIIGTVMAGYDGHRGWINYLAVSPAIQQGGVGRQLMDHAEALLRERGCPKVNLQVRAGNRAVAAFYKRLGYLVEDRIDFGKRLG